MTADEEPDDTDGLFTLFTNLCAFLNTKPLDALKRLAKKDWDDDSDFSSAVTHIRTGL